jgi:hypothetical protein
VPPLVGVAVNVTEVPAQTLLAEGDDAMLTGTTGFTVMVIGLEVAGLLLTQFALDVSTQLTTSLLVGA